MKINGKMLRKAERTARLQAMKTEGFKRASVIDGRKPYKTERRNTKAKLNQGHWD